MLGGVLAISDFMLILLTSALWVGAGMLGAGLIGVGALGGMAIALKRWLRPRT
jgi:hypothetical protein